MKRLAILLAFVLALSASSPVFAATRSSGSRSSSSRSSTSSPSPTPPPSTQSKAWSSTTKYGTGRGTLVGNGKLKSKTTPPKPHTHNGTKYNSSDAPYTNVKGNWVFYWVPIAGSRSVACYDKDHKRVPCDRDKKSYAVNW